MLPHLLRAARASDATPRTPQVVAGAHHVGELGMVNHVEGAVAMVLLDSSAKEVKVLVNNLTATLDTHSGLESFGQFALHQAVLLTDNTAGMIVNISPEACSVLTNSGASPPSIPPFCAVHEPSAPLFSEEAHGGACTRRASAQRVTRGAAQARPRRPCGSANCRTSGAASRRGACRQQTATTAA